MSEIVQSLIAVIGLCVIVHIIRTTGQYAREVGGSNREEAHRIILDLASSEEMMESLPRYLRNEIKDYINLTRANNPTN